MFRYKGWLVGKAEGETVREEFRDVRMVQPE